MTDTSIQLHEAERRDLLPILIQLLYVVAPLEILMIYVGATKLTAGMAIGALLGLVGLLLFASSRLSLSWRADRPMVYVLVFLCLATLSTVRTNYGAPAIQKGAINLFAMLAMVSMVLVAKQAFSQWPNLFPHVARITAITTAIAGFTVICQSFVSNVLFLPELFDLSFLNSLIGTTWWDLSTDEGLLRAHGIFGEPAFLAGYIGIASGLAMTRLGLFGSQWRDELCGLVPAWAAWIIVVSLILSFSAVVYAGLLVTCLGGMASKTTFSVRSILILVIGSVAAVLILVLLAMQTDAIVDRITGLIVLGQLYGNQSNELDAGGVNASVQVLFLNAYVALQNLIANPLLGAGVGAHPFAYDALLPALPTASPITSSIIGLNAMDANALALRLLSETGLLGTAMFTGAVLSAWLRVRKLLVTPDANARPAHPSFGAIAIGLNASLAGVFAAMMFRLPNYYAAEFWALFALCAAIPVLAPMSASAIWRRPRHNS